MSYISRFTAKCGLALGLAIAAAASGYAQSPGASDPMLGTWTNPSNSIEVRTEYCGRNLCGVVTKASPTAVADARKAGVTDLIGQHLLQNFTRVDTHAWSGTAFVPDMNLHVSAHLVLVSDTQMKISGCELGGLICKSQQWTRVSS